MRGPPGVWLGPCRPSRHAHHDLPLLVAPPSAHPPQDAYLYNSILYTLLLMHNRDALRVLLGHTRRAGEAPDAAAHRWLRTALDGARITRGQAEKAVAAYRTYMQRMRQLGAESEAALQALRAAQQVRRGQLPGRAAIGERGCRPAPPSRLPPAAADQPPCPLPPRAQDLSAAAFSRLGPNSSLGASLRQYLELVEAGGALSAAADGALLVLLDFIFASGGCCCAGCPWRALPCLSCCRARAW